MKPNRVFVVTPTKIENWDEGGAYYRIVFARSREQAAAVYAAYDMIHEGYGLDEANPEDPYVYRIRVSARELRRILGGNGYRALIEEPGASILDDDYADAKLAAYKLMEIFMGAESRV